MRCEICIRELWHDMFKNIYILKTVRFLVRALKTIKKSPREEILSFCKNII